MNGYIIALVILVALIFFVECRKPVDYLCGSYAYYKIARNSNDDMPWLCFIPFVRYIRMAKLINKQGYTITWLEPLIMIASLVGIIGLLPFNLSLFGTLSRVCIIILSCFRLYVVGRYSLVLEGRYNILAIIVAIFGFDGLAMFWITRNMN